MPYINHPLPEYPCQNDVWDVLSKEKRPILIYGMGNGADKLINRFQALGISFADIFASDGFVRGHSFHGIRVKSFSEVKEKYRDFVIVLSFASNKRDVIDMLTEIDEKYDFYIPDMPIAGEDEYFDKEFYNSHYTEIKSTYDLLYDTESKSIYSAAINYRLTGKLSYLLDAYSDKNELYELLNKKNITRMVDAGAYNGDTLREAIEYFPNLKYAYAIEPDRKNFKKLSAFAKECRIDVNVINAAVWSESCDGTFSNSGNRNSSVSSTASYKHTDTSIRMITVDSFDDCEIDYIKYDVEGAELEALIGSEKTITNSKPALLISVYHRSSDIFKIAEFLNRNVKGYRFYLRRLLSVPAWEIDLILIPEKQI